MYRWARLLRHLIREALKVLRFGDHRDDRVIGRLGVNGDPSENPPGIICCGQQSVLEKGGINVVRATKGCQDATELEQLERPQMNLFIPAQGVGNRSPVPGKGR